VRALARRIGFPEERVLGIEFHLQGGRYTDRAFDPPPIGEGKLELFLDTVGRSPVLTMGDSMNDFDLLENCEGLSIVMDRNDEEIVECAAEHSWMVQGLLSV
jgi:phosphoserine phosphatase